MARASTIVWAAHTGGAIAQSRYRGMLRGSADKLGILARGRRGSCRVDRVMAAERMSGKVIGAERVISRLMTCGGRLVGELDFRDFESRSFAGVGWDVGALLYSQMGDGDSRMKLATVV